MNIQYIIQDFVSQAVKSLYSTEVKPSDVQVQETRKEFSGDFTVVIFPLTRASKTSPQLTANEIGIFLKDAMPQVKSFEIVQGFLNLLLHDSFWYQYLQTSGNEWEQAVEKQTIMVEYSSPNTNKPLHLGHARNNLLGYSVAEILKARGHHVIKANLINDRGIHICKSMLAWLKFGNGETPETFGQKGDHLVGKYYVEFDKALKGQIYELETLGKLTKEEAAKQAPLMLEAQEMLLKWEAGDPETRRVWQMMNTWVYKGFDETYKALGVDFDKFYYESQTYLLGKDVVNEGLAKGVFTKREDGSVWIDLTDEGLDEKLVLRKDGTSVYITQDMGTITERFRNYALNRMIYVVGNEQEYHFKVLRGIFKKFGTPWWNDLFHLSYGMVELPSGKMKSREGTVVDTDELIEEMLETAAKQTKELGKLEGLSEDEQNELFRKIGMAALKFYILKADPKKQMMFDPKESIDFMGFTGPFIQYTYTRIKSIFRKAEADGISVHASSATLEGDLKMLSKSPEGDWKMSYASDAGDAEGKPIHTLEKELLRLLYKKNSVLADAETNLSPALVANYAYELAKAYNKFYHDHKVLAEPDAEIRNFRLALSDKTAKTILACMTLLGIELPEKM
jgi:arginyl-tRNA synthetase